MELEALDSGLGALLPQRETTSGKLKPCAFFSKKFSSAEQNYDIGNRELLAIKFALEEAWRGHRNHSMSGPIIRTLPTYILLRDSILHKPVGAYSSTDSISPSPTDPAVIMLSLMLFQVNSTPLMIIPTPLFYPPTCIVGTLTWDIESRVQQSQGEEPVILASTGPSPYSVNVSFGRLWRRMCANTWGPAPSVRVHSPLTLIPLVCSTHYPPPVGPGLTLL